jgi:hypothetical protein
VVLLMWRQVPVMLRGVLQAVLAVDVAQAVLVVVLWCYLAQVVLLATVVVVVGVVVVVPVTVELFGMRLIGFLPRAV